MKRFSQELEQQVITLYTQGLSMKECGKQCGINATSVFNILKRNNITSRTKGGIDPISNVEIADLYKQGKSCQEIANMFNVTVHAISDRLEKLNIPRNNIYYNKTLIKDYWQDINSPDKAYFLGFLLTDGNVCGNLIRLELHIQDVDILNTFLKYTKNQNKLCYSKNRPHCSFQVKRKQWVEDLSKYGMVENKTYITTYPSNIKDELTSHFIRGLIDGDGWISYKAHSIGFCGNKDIVESVRDILVEKLGVYKVKILHPSEHLWQISWAGKSDVIKIGRFIYKDKSDLFLKRKYDHFVLIDNTELTS